LFPVGDYLKPEVRTLAKKAGLPTAEKKDSQGICFLGKVSLADFLKKRIRSKSGLVLNIAGKAVGKHDGSCFYTIGQRHGLGIAAPRPLYIAEKNIKKNLLVMAEGKNNPALYKKEIFLKNINFINYGLGFKNRKLNIPVLARVRYRQPLGKAVLSRLGNVRLKLVFVNPQKFVAPGQSAVFYSNKGEMLGGGVIL
jgi:tRNA-specific 2-thiouridylase